MSDEIQYREGLNAGEAWARATGTTEADIHMVPAVKGTRAYRSGFRVGVAKVRNERHRAEVTRQQAEASGLFDWGHGDCDGTFEFHERLPKATVYACGTCSQHRVVQDDPAAHDRAMAALADYLIDAAGE